MNNTLALQKVWVEDGIRYTQDYVTGLITSTPITTVDLSIPGFMYIKELQMEHDKALSEDPVHKARVKRIIAAELKRKKDKELREKVVRNVKSTIRRIRIAKDKFYGNI